MSEWIDCVVGDIAAPVRNALVGGPFGSNLVSKDYVDYGIPVIRGQNMGTDRWVSGDFVFVSESKAQSLSANIARPSDLVFTQRGTLGQLALVPKDSYDRYVVSQSQMKLTADPKKADPLFLYYCFSSSQQIEYILQNAIQTRVPHTNLTILRNTPLSLPPLSEQRAIAHILGSLDDKIELNRRMNATLEATARALFQSWFVDFDPVHAKVRGEQPSGMDAATAALFPDHFEDSPLGPIPAGWRTGTFGEIVDINKGDIVDGPFGSNLKSEDYKNEGVRLIHQQNINEYNFVDKEKRYISFDKANELNRSAAYPGDVVLTKMPEPITRAAIIPHGISDKFIIVADCIRIRPHPIFSPSAYILYLINSPAFRREAEAQATGTTRMRINLTQVKSIHLVIPPPNIREKIANDYLSAIEQKRENNEAETRILAETRDALLPKFISGKLRVENMENLIERTS